MKLVWEVIKFDFSVTGDFFTDLIIGTVLFGLLDVFAFRRVGVLYRMGLIRGRAIGSILNYSIKIGSTLVLMKVLRLGVEGYRALNAVLF